MTNFLLNHGLELVIWLAAALVALIRWNRHPKVSLLALVAISLFLVDVFVTGGITTRQALAPLRRNRAPAEWLVWVTALVHLLLNAAGWVFIVLAIFTGRGKKAEPAPTVVS